jgi:hypothetical protein
MRKYIGTLAALSAALSMSVIVPAAQARPGHHYRGHGGHHYSHGGHHYGHYRGHRGHGYWHNGRWIALGIGAAIAAGAAGAYGDCYYRNGYRYCD